MLPTATRATLVVRAEVEAETKAAAKAAAKAEASTKDEKEKEEGKKIVPSVPAPSLSRDFSLHVLGARLVSSGAQHGGAPLSSPSTSLSTVQYIVDPRNEDRPDGTCNTEEQNGESISTVDATFEHVMNTCGGGSGAWTGIRGKDTVPSWAEWQRALLAAGNGGMFLSYGLGPCLSHFPPERLAGMSTAGGVRVALLIGRSSTESSLRRLAKLANKKTASTLRLEQSVETSMLMTLAGVDCVVLNSWAASLSANRRLLLSMMSNVASGKTISQAVEDASERGHRSKIDGADGNGKKKGESKGSEIKRLALKSRVRLNPTVYGIPHVVASKK